MRADLAHEGHAVWTEIAPKDGAPGFERGEFRNPDKMCPDFLRRLRRARLLTCTLTSFFEGHSQGVPFRITSDYRTTETNKLVGGAAVSAHTEVPCRAVDLRVKSARERYIILTALLTEAFERIGIEEPTPAQRALWGADAGTVHVDASPDLPQAILFTTWNRSK